MNKILYLLLKILIITAICSCGKDTLEEQGEKAPIVFRSPSNDVSTSPTGSAINYEVILTTDTVIDSLVMSYYFDKSGTETSLDPSKLVIFKVYNLQSQNKNIWTITDALTYVNDEVPTKGSQVYIVASMYTRKRTNQKQIKVSYI